jgi:hypothetical protein
MIDYDGRRFRKAEPSGDDGTVRPAPTAQYHQDGDLVWAEFVGGDVRRGSLTGVCAPDGALDFAYSMVLTSGEVISGRSLNTPELLADGRIRMHEKWERYGPHAATGISYLEEVR